MKQTNKIFDIDNLFCNIQNHQCDIKEGNEKCDLLNVKKKRVHVSS